MTTIYPLPSSTRKLSTKGYLGTLRKQGFIPGVIYGGKKDSQPEYVQIDAKAFKKARTPGYRAHIFSLSDNQLVLIKDLQFDPVTVDPIHIDMVRVDRDALLTVSVPIRFSGEDACPGRKRGGILNIVLSSLKVRASMQAMPEALVADISECKLGDAIYVRDLQIPQGAELIGVAESVTVATILQPSGLTSEESKEATPTP